MLEDYVSFLDMRDIALFRLTMKSRNVGLKQRELWFFTVLQSTLQTETEDKAKMREADQDIMKHSVLNSIALTRDCSSLCTENGLHSLHYSWICEVSAIRKH